MFVSNSHLEFVAKTCPKLEVLNLNLRKTREEFDEIDGNSGFEDVGNDGLRALANGCPNLSKEGVICWMTMLLKQLGLRIRYGALNLEASSLVTDHGLAALATGYISISLKKLVLAECDRITDSGVSMLKHICCLEELNLAECGPKITDSGCELVTGAGVRAFGNHERLEYLVLASCYNIGGYGPLKKAGFELFLASLPSCN
ncbi:hypothetical protein QQP08_024607 [Theobroma cacao]|nr:hypothetical protein QQP08_024607 [Theobroma cacao]